MDDQKGWAENTNWPLILVAQWMLIHLFFIVKKKVQVARDRDITGERKRVSSLQNSLPSSGKRELDPSGPVQICASSSPTACGGMPAFIRMLGMFQAADGPRSLFSWLLLSPQVPNRSPILLSFIVSILRLILAGSPDHHIHFHYWVYWHTSLNWGSSFSLTSQLGPQTLPPPPFTSKSPLFHGSLLGSYFQVRVALVEGESGYVPSRESVPPHPRGGLWVLSLKQT